MLMHTLFWPGTSEQNRKDWDEVNKHRYSILTSTSHVTDKKLKLKFVLFNDATGTH